MIRPRGRPRSWRGALLAAVLLGGSAATASAAVPWRIDNPPAGPSAVANELLAVAPVPGTSAFWAVGWHASGGRHQGLIERRMAAGWTRVPAPAWPRGAELDAVAARSSADAWAVGRRPRPAAPGFRPVILHWNGISWASVPVASAGRSAKLTGVTITAAGRVFAVGAVAGGPFSGALVERWDGAGFVRVPISRTQGLSAIGSGAGGGLWAVAADGTLFHRPPRAAGWHLVPGRPLPRRTAISSILVTAPGTTVWLFGDHFTPTNTQLAVIERYRAGTWTRVPGLAGGLNVTAAARVGNRGFLAAGTGSTGVFVWSDDGSTLSAMTVPQPVANPAGARILGIARAASGIAELGGWLRTGGAIDPFAERNP